MRLNQSEVYKPGRGIFRHTRFRETEPEEEVAADEQVAIKTPTATIREEDFYAPFAEWIKNELEEWTRTIPLGQNRFKDKWGTPDVIGSERRANATSSRYLSRLFRQR
jgi:hypothetical protein